MITIHDVEQGSPEWLALRENFYTGTGAENLLKFSGHLKIINGVASSYALSEITGFKGNFHTQRGHILEDEAIELYSTITGRSVSRPGFVTNSDYPICGYSPDGLDDELDILLEVKCFNPDKHMAMLKGDIPTKVLAQIHFGQFIWEKHGAKLLVYNPDLEAEYALGVIDIPYNQKIIDNFKRKIAPQEVAA